MNRISLEDDIQKMNLSSLKGNSYKKIMLCENCVELWGNWGNFLTHREFLDHKCKNGKWNHHVGETRRSAIKPYFVKLAPESPPGKTNVICDESSYDSFHNYETGECWNFNRRLVALFSI